MNDNETIVRNFIAAWSRLDAAELVGFFTEDGTYHNMMAKPVSGHDDLRKFIAGLLKGGRRRSGTSLRWSHAAMS